MSLPLSPLYTCQDNFIMQGFTLMQPDCHQIATKLPPNFQQIAIKLLPDCHFNFQPTAIKSCHPTHCHQIATGSLLNFHLIATKPNYLLQTVTKFLPDWHQIANSVPTNYHKKFLPGQLLGNHWRHYKDIFIGISMAI